MSILLVLLIISFLVWIHELAHFLAAKKVGIKVEEFGFGYPPRLLKLFHWRGTDFTLNWLPFGGFVRLFGDSVETIEESGVEQKKNKQDSELAQFPHHHFEGKSIPQRLFVILAGAFINLLIGVLAFTGIYSSIGIPTTLPHPQISTVESGTPADKAGLRVGDQMLEIAQVQVSSMSQFIAEVQKHRGETIELKYVRDKETLTTTIYVRKQDEIPNGQGSLGVVLQDFAYVRESAWKMPFLSIQQGFKDSWQFSGMILSSLQSMVGQLITKGQVPKDVSGPLGIVTMAEKENLAQQGVLGVLGFLGVISINLGIMNLLPIPALDGGRAMFLLLEKVLGKNRRISWEQKANTVGMTLLLVLIVAISIKDIFAIFRL